MKRFVLLAALCACGAKKSTPSCDDLRPMVDRMYASMLAELGPGMKPHERERAAQIGVQVAPAMKTAIVEACHADRWPSQVITCAAGATSGAALDACEAQLPEAARAHVESAMAEVVSSIPPPDEPAEDSDEETGVGESGLPECDAYARAMEQYLDCDEIAEPVKDSARGALAELRKTWPMLKDPATGAQARQAAAAACTSARAELDKSAQAMGCDKAAAAAPDCGVLGPMIRAILDEQLRDVPADKRDAAAAQSRALAAPLEHSLVDTCERGRWSADAVACFDRARSAQALVACEARLTPDQAEALAHAMEDVTQKIAGGGAPGLPDCDAYIAAINALLACDKLPAADRASLQRSMSLVVDGMKRIGDANADLAHTCTAAHAAVVDRAAKLGCAIK